MKKFNETNMKSNMEILNNSDLEFTFNQRIPVVLVRKTYVPKSSVFEPFPPEEQISGPFIKRRISADFYPSTNKWKDNIKGQKIHYGNAERFIEWIKTQ